MSPAHAACSGLSEDLLPVALGCRAVRLVGVVAQKERRTPHQPNAMSMEEVSVILAAAVARPTWAARCCGTSTHEGCTARLRRGEGPAGTTWHCQAARGGLGVLTAADAGQVTTPRWKARSGLPMFTTRKWVSLDTFHVGRPKASAPSGNRPRPMPTSIAVVQASSATRPP